MSQLKALFCMLLWVTANTIFAQRAPDYSNLHDWAAHPLKQDPADTIHVAFREELRDTVADVFFIHPTSYINNLRTSHWNGNMDDEILNDETDKGAILNQASIFNARARVFAPRYRQAHLKAFFLTRNPKSTEALELAYADVKAAFEYYLKHENNGRPVIIASHSQGTRHAVRLLQEYFDGKPLQQKLVCAYLVGWTVMKDDFKHILLSTSPEQTGCYVTWRSMKTGYIDKYSKKGKGRITCSNPITWKTDAGKTQRSQHRGAMKANLTAFFPQLVEVEVNTSFGVLWVNAGNGEMGNDHKMVNYHIGDFNLFYADVRYNVNQRINAFLKR